jgi:predicted N-acyltransferase
VPLATTIADLDPAELGRFGEALYDTSFLGFVEDEHRGRAEARYFFINDGPRLSSFAVGYVYTGPAIPFTFRFEEFLGGDFSRDLLGKAPRYLVVGAPIRLRSRVLAESQTAQATLVEAIVAHAHNDALDGVVFSFVHASDRWLVQTLRSAGFVSAFYEGDFYLPVDGAETLEEFLTQLPRNPRTQLRRDFNHFRRSGLTVAVTTDLTSRADTLATQHRALMDAYHREPELNEASFARFEQHVSKRRLTLACDGSGDSVAYVLSTFSDDDFEVLRFGRRADLDVRDGVYGTLVFTESVRQAIALGCSRIHVGKASQHAKTLRGCSYEEGIVFARWLSPGPHAQMSAALTTLDATNRARFARMCLGAVEDPKR